MELKDAGISAILCDGTGGTSFSRVESLRGGLDGFDDWGIPTPISILECRGIAPLVAGGGIRSGLQMAKAIALGADLCEIALPVLLPATRSADEVEALLKRFVRELRTAMFLTGSAGIDDLRRVPFVLEGLTDRWAVQRRLLQG